MVRAHSIGATEGVVVIWVISKQWMMRRIPSCRRAAQLLSEAMDRRLSLGERLALQLHLRLCVLCERYRRQLDIVRAAIRRHAGRFETAILPEEVVLSSGARQRLLEALRRGA